MLTNFFKKVVLTGALAMAATPAFGGSFYDQYLTFDRDTVKSQCTDNNFKAIPKGMINNVKAMDLTNQSQACITRVLDNMSTSRQIMFVESDNTALRQQSLTAAQKIQSDTGNEVLIALYKDTTPNDNKAYVSIWSDGHERASSKIKEDYGINNIVLNESNFINETVRISKEVQTLKDLADKNHLAMN